MAEMLEAWYGAWGLVWRLDINQLKSWEYGWTERKTHHCMGEGSLVAQ